MLIPPAQQFICMVCKSIVGAIKQLPVSSGFSSMNLLADGDGCCESCYKIIKNPQSRKSCWIKFGSKDIQTFKRKDLHEILIGPKIMPFIIYVTATFKKQGFLKGMARPNLGVSKFNVIFDDDIIPVVWDDLEMMIGECRQFRRDGWTKTELIHGPFTVRYENRERCAVLNKLRERPMWRLVVHGDDTEIGK